MENPRPEKVAVVEEVREKLSGARATLLTEYRGLSVTELAALRRSLREAGGEYKVYKNTLVRFAVRDLGLPLEELLTGPNALAFVEEDAVGVAKALADFARTNDKLVIKGGLLGEQVLSAADVNALAKLPSREQLLARLAGGFAAPLQKMAGLLQALPRNFAYGLKALIDQGGAQPGAAAPTDEPQAATEEPAGAEEAAEAPAAEAATEAAEAPTAEAATEAVETDETPETNDTDAAEASSEPAADAAAEPEQES